FGGDEVEGFVERHDDGPEVAGGGPALVAPPQDLHVITLAGRPQARDLAASASAIQCIAPCSLVLPRHHRAARDELRSARAWHQRRPSCPPAPAWVAPSRAAAKAEADAMPAPVPAVLAAWMRPFRGYFTTAVWRHALVLVAGVLLAPGRRTVTAALRVMGL